MGSALPSVVAGGEVFDPTDFAANPAFEKAPPRGLGPGYKGPYQKADLGFVT